VESFGKEALGREFKTVDWILVPLVVLFVWLGIRRLKNRIRKSQT
jgi:uncharacterized membrane-anchored protein